jgi:hypothetical protein
VQYAGNKSCMTILPALVNIWILVLGLWHAYLKYYDSPAHEAISMTIHSSICTLDWSSGIHYCCELWKRGLEQTFGVQSRSCRSSILLIPLKHWTVFSPDIVGVLCQSWNTL